jgi:hypothetical protein
MVDGRRAPRRPARGQVDPRVVDELRKLMDQAADGSTRTVSYYLTRLGRAVKKLDGPPVTMPSRATFYRLFNRLEAGRHTTGSARTRRSLASQPDGAFDQTAVCRPGELMEIDSTPFDVLVRLDNGVVDRCELGCCRRPPRSSGNSPGTTRCATCASGAARSPQMPSPRRSVTSWSERAPVLREPPRPSRPAAAEGRRSPPAPGQPPSLSLAACGASRGGASPAYRCTRAMRQHGGGGPSHASEVERGAAVPGLASRGTFPVAAPAGERVRPVRPSPRGGRTGLHRGAGVTRRRRPSPGPRRRTCPSP